MYLLINFILSGEALAQREKDIKQPQLPELPVDECELLIFIFHTSL